MQGYTHAPKIKKSKAVESMVIPGTKHAKLKHVKHTQALSPLTWLPKQNTKKNEGHGTEADCWYAGH